MNQSARKTQFKKSLLQTFLTTLATGGLVTLGVVTEVKAEMTDSPKVVVDEVWQLVNNEFVNRDFNRVDWQAKREELLQRNYDSTKEAYREIKKVLQDLGDPYTRFLPPSQFKQLTSQTSGEVSGIGIRIAIDKRTQDVIIIDTIRNSPAQEAGLERGDRIVKINGKPTALMNIEQASEAIKGELGTDVDLQIMRPDKPAFEVTVTRQQIEVASVEFDLKQEGNLNIGYIRLDEFSSHAAEQMKEAIEKLHEQEASAFVLDLRGNPGGLLFASVDIARMWLSEGEIVDIVDRQGGHRSFEANNSALTDLPLVILVDKRSASASEILAGALKENRRAIVVGTNTYGKGTVQSVHSLSDGSGLAVTISRYYPPSGTNINQKGIEPDVFQNISREQGFVLRKDPSLIATPADPQYLRAITVLKTKAIKPAQFKPNPVSILQ